MLEEMRDFMTRGMIPQIRKGQKCSGCSMKDLCMPQIKKIREPRAEIEKIGQEEL